ncbi:TetR/AcrR family transcriptional regulator [Nocardiopsis alba]|uniref:TetR/AcrR family transcriptional regulator n=1 Tax=Nocardiopsis alba TaxID=53437 RepID=UPI0033BEF04E
MASRHRSSAPDRREALKARHRRAIIDAAWELILEIGGTDFTVDRLAERADVSRRTVFNHFKTVDDIIVEVFGRMLGVVLDNVDANLAASAGEGDGETAMFDRVAAALRATDLVTPIRELTRLFDSGGGRTDPRRAVLLERTITDLGTRIAITTLRHHPRADPLEVDLMCGALVGGALAVVRHWEEATGGVDTAESRLLWDRLLGRMIHTYRDGFGALAAGSDTP